MLKVWTHGHWAAEQEIDTASKDELVVKVAAPHSKSEDKEGKEGE